MWLHVTVNCEACRLSYQHWAEAPDEFSVVLHNSKCPICGHDNSDTYMIDPDFSKHSPRNN